MVLEVIMLKCRTLHLASRRSETQEDKRPTSCEAPCPHAPMFELRTFSHSVQTNITKSFST